MSGDSTSKIKHERFAGSEKIKELEKDPEGLWLLHQAFAYGATEKDLVNLSKQFLKVPHEKSPDQKAFDARFASAGGGTKEGYAAFVRHQVQLQKESGESRLSHARAEEISALVRAYMLKNQPNRLWRFEPASRMMASSLLRLGLSFEYMARALSLFLTRGQSEELISPSAVRGWCRDTMSRGTTASELPGLLESGLTIAPEDAEQARQISQRLKECLEARRSEHSGWKRINEARAVVAAIVEYYYLNAETIRDRTSPTHGAVPAARILRERFGEEAQLDHIKAGIDSDIKRVGTEAYVEKLRRGIYLPEGELSQLLEKAADIANNAHHHHQALKDVNYAVAARMRTGGTEPSAAEQDEMYLANLMKRKAGDHGGVPYIRKGKSKPKE